MAAAVNFVQLVEKLREQIGRTREEITWLDTSRLPADELKANVTAWVQQMAAKGVEESFANQLLNLAEVSGAGRVEAGNALLNLSCTPVQFGLAGSAVAYQPIHAPMAPLMAWLLGDELTRMLHAKVDALKYTPGPPLAERAQLRAGLVGELRRLEGEEEALILRAEEASLIIARRADADPAVVLNYDPRGTMRETGEKKFFPIPKQATPAAAAPTGEAPGSAPIASHQMPAPAASASRPGAIDLARFFRP